MHFLYLYWYIVHAQMLLRLNTTFENQSNNLKRVFMLLQLCCFNECHHSANIFTEVEVSVRSVCPSSVCRNRIHNTDLKQLQIQDASWQTMMVSKANIFHTHTNFMQYSIDQAGLTSSTSSSRQLIQLGGDRWCMT